MWIIEQDKTPENCHGQKLVKAENLQTSKLCAFDSSFLITHTHIYTNIHTQGFLFYIYKIYIDICFIYIYIYIY